MGEIYHVYRRGKKIAVRDLDTGLDPMARKRRKDCCALVPELWVEKLLPALSTNATRWLAVVLLWRSFRNRGHPFACPNLKRYGISEYQKRNGLAELEEAGLIAVVERLPGRSPRVKIVLDPSKN
jgi:hypothetical protein